LSGGKAARLAQPPGPAWNEEPSLTTSTTSCSRSVPTASLRCCDLEAGESDRAADDVAEMLARTLGRE